MAGEAVDYKAGVHANYAIDFKIDVSGLSYIGEITLPKTPKSITDVESLSISFDNGVEEWNPMDSKGWVKRFVTAKSISIAISAKRNEGDPGNDYIASRYMKKGNACYSFFIIDFPNGDCLGIPCVINVTSLGGDSTSIDSMEFELLSHGEPEYIEDPSIV